jgi:hypothetical protein
MLTFRHDISEFLSTPMFARKRCMDRRVKPGDDEMLA